MKKEITQRFEDFVKWVKDNNLNDNVVAQAESIKNGVCKYMNSESYYNEYWEQFIDYTKKLDNIRNESLLETEKLFTKYIERD